MTYGLQVSNASGYLQVDELYENYALVQEGTSTTTSRVSVPNLGGPLNSLVFVRLPVGKGIAGCHTFSDFFYLLKVIGDPDFTFEYRVYRRNGQLPITQVTHGFMVFNSGGGLVFDSSRRYPRLKSVSIVNPSTVQLPTTVPGIGINPWVYANTYGTYKFVNRGGYYLDWHDLCLTVQSDYSILLTSKLSGSNAGMQLLQSPFYVGGPRQILLSI